MKAHAQVAVIGGGVVGCSVLYHLTKFGCTDVVLCERKELTAGSSWHAAGQIHALNSDPAVARLQGYTIALYREIQEVSGQDVGLHLTGGLLVAETQDRWDFLRADCARQQMLGADTELISPAQIRELCPIMDTSRVRGAIYDPREGHLDPYGATNAYAKAARLKGAEIYRRTHVTQIMGSGRGTWLVVTDQGTIECEHVVNAAGLWAREVGQMVGVELPLVPMEHHYLVTEDLPELAQLSHELPGILDLDGEIYLRQERKGMLLGVYEKDATPWAVGGTPWDHGETELLAPNLDRLADTLQKGFERFPLLANAGIRRIVNGPFTFTPDGNPLVGPLPGLRNYWAACGVMAGFCQGGGVGLALAQWIVDGEPEGDIYAMDVGRFGPYVTKNYTVGKAREFYSRRFQIAYPNEYWPAGRPSKTSAAHHRLKAANAVFGVSYGLEFPRYFALPGQTPAETPTLRRSNAFQAVREECHAARGSVGILDISSFSKYEVAGPQAAAALDKLLAGRLPAVGRIRLTPMLARSGRLMGDLTTMRLSDDRFQIGGSGYLQTWHMRWFSEHLAQDGVLLRNITDHYGGLALIGPRSRELLARLSGTEVSDSILPFMAVARMDLAFAPAIVARLSVTGELGYEIYVPTLHLSALLDAVLEATSGLGARLIGVYALNSLRLEKSFGIWSREYSRDYTPRMAGLDRFVAYDKPDFVGRDAALRDRACAPDRRLVTMAVESPEADAAGYEPIWLGTEMVGFVTSGGYGHCAGMSLAMGYLQSAIPDTQTGLSVSILGERCDCRILTEPPIDPMGARMRG
ncbi:MAG: FAD-dependent oxidoreductase [Steroidobacteraceae bacterium]